MHVTMSATRMSPSSPQTGCGGIPVEPRARLEGAYVVGAADQCAHRGEVGKARPQGAGLDQAVAQRGSLGRAGEDRQSEGVSGELAEEVVLRPTADDVDDPDVAAGERRGEPDVAP